MLLLWWLQVDLWLEESDDVEVLTEWTDGFLNLGKNGLRLCSAAVTCTAVGG